jgi:hypothetical protein
MKFKKTFYKVRDNWITDISTGYVEEAYCNGLDVVYRLRKKPAKYTLKIDGKSYNADVLENVNIHTFYDDADLVNDIFAYWSDVTNKYEMLFTKEMVAKFFKPAIKLRSGYHPIQEQITLDVDWKAIVEKDADLFMTWASNWVRIYKWEEKDNSLYKFFNDVYYIKVCFCPDVNIYPYVLSTNYQALREGTCQEPGDEDDKVL